MNPGIKTLKDWTEFANHTGRTSIYDYIRKGDIVSEDLVEHFLNVMPPRAMGKGYLQMGEPYSHAYDIDRKLRATYLTFARGDGQWRYCGNCFAWETIDRTYF